MYVFQGIKRHTGKVIQKLTPNPNTELCSLSLQAPLRKREVSEWDPGATPLHPTRHAELAAKYTLV